MEKILKINEAREYFYESLLKWHTLYSKERIFKGNREYKNILPIAGKNFGVFDEKVLQMNDFNKAFELMDHRYIDVGNLYFMDFGFVPSLKQINQKFGKQSVSHRALEDALDVRDAIVKKVMPTINNGSSLMFHPFVSIDTETTGLPKENPYVLEIGMVFEDYGYFDLKKEEREVSFLIDNGKLDKKRCGEFAMNMNKGILDLIYGK